MGHTTSVPEAERAGAPVIVIGGGLAGLVTANLLADRGLAVTLLEARQRLGGRAATDERRGHLFNRGPHALYRAGPAMGVLGTLGLDPTGGTPGNGGLGLLDDRMGLLPGGPGALLRTRLLSPGDKVAAARILGRIGSIEAGVLGDRSAEQWIVGMTGRPRLRQLLRAVTRLSTYCADLDLLSARVAASQVKLSLGGGVLYPDGGWQRITDQLADRARARGVTIETGVRVDAVHGDDAGSGIGVRHAATGRRASAVILAGLPPGPAARLSGSRALADLAAAATPIRAACLDVGLRSLPHSGRRFALGLDRPLYFSVHNPPADLGTGVTLHAMRYLEAGRTPSPPSGAELRAELESLLDRLQPGWRSVLVTSRFHRQLLVATTVPTPGPDSRSGGRAEAIVADRPGVFLAGDWVGQVGHLADAAVASAAEAADAVADRLVAAAGAVNR